jgi:streptogramin lyase
MKTAALLVAVAAAIALPAAAVSSPETSERASGRIPAAHSVRACAGAGPYWPTMTLALQGRTAWVACKEQARLVRLTLPGGRKTSTVGLGGPVIAVAVGLGSVWALDTGSTLYRLDAKRARVTKRIQLGANAPYNIWIGGGAVWVADDQGAAVLRVSPASNKVVARIPVGDGPADMVFRGSQAWVVTHRDNTIFRIDTATNVATRIGSIGGDDAAAERLALLGDALWITGRGMSLVEMDPATGAIRRTLGIGGTGIDVIAAAGALWVPVRTAAVDRTGFPTMTAVRRVAADGSVKTAATARGRVDVHGLAAGLGSVWIADNTNGRLYRLAA